MDSIETIDREFQRRYDKFSQMAFNGTIMESDFEDAYEKLMDERRIAVMAIMERGKEKL